MPLLDHFHPPLKGQRHWESFHGRWAASMADFLNRDTNSLATFIVIRETMGSGRNDLVHGFANRRHPHLPPPTLKLTTVPKG